MYGINAEIALRLKAVQAEFGLASPAAIAGQALGPYGRTCHPPANPQYTRQSAV
jgi:hypothetical protein